MVPPSERGIPRSGPRNLVPHSVGEDASLDSVRKGSKILHEKPYFIELRPILNDPNTTPEVGDVAVDLLVELHRSAMVESGAFPRPTDDTLEELRRERDEAATPQPTNG